MAIKTIDGAKWSCRGCGDCCRGFAFGPVEPAVIAGLQAADIAAQWAPAAEAPWFATRPDGQHFLTHRDGHCVFLQDDSLCAVHRLLGEPAKPWFCREYPFHAVEEPGGDIAVTVRADCGGLHESFEDGEPIAAQAEAVLALPRIVPRQVFAPKQVVILPRVAVGLDNWLQIEPHLLAHLAASRTPEAASASTRGMLLSMAGRPAVDSDPVAHAAAMLAVIAGLRQAADAEAPPPYRAKLAWAAGILDDLDLSRPLPPLSEASLRYLGLILRGEVLTRRLGTVGGLPAMMGLFMVETAIARHIAGGDAPLTPSDLGATLPRFRRALHLPPLWAQVRASKELLEALFMTV
ncbi:MAG: Fe-S-cluster containining protein [Myxococcota bacterium]|jgi:Fe-S-cluster containining protein